MNPEDAKRKFVEGNLLLLTADPFDQQTYKSVHRKFFVEELRNKCGQPGFKEIARALVRLLKQRGLESAKIRGYIDSLGFFSRLDEKQRHELQAVADDPTLRSALDAQDLMLLRGGQAFRGCRAT